MAFATEVLKEFKAQQADMATLASLETHSPDDLQKAKELAAKLEATEAEYKRLRALDEATDRRERERVEEEKAARQLERKPVERITPLDSKGDPIVEELKRITPTKQTWLESFVKSEMYQGIRKNGGHSPSSFYSLTFDDQVIFKSRDNLDFKAAGDPVVTSQFQTRTTDLTVPPHFFAPTNVIDLFSVQNISFASLRYFAAINPMGGAANWVAEATLKPEVQPRWQPVDAPVETLADWTAVTLQALDDIPQLRAVLDFDLRRAVEVKLADSLLNGSGTSPQIRGLLNFTGIQSVAFVATTSAIDMIAAGISAVNSTGYGNANAVVMNPSDYWKMRLSKSAQGVYYFGDPFAVGQKAAWGIPVVTAPQLAAGTALVGDFSYATFFQRMGITFIVGLKNDDLLKNLQTIVCEMRGVLAVRRPEAFAKVALV